MTYYDYTLEGEYQSEERALSFIHALKNVFNNKDAAPNITNQIRFLIPVDNVRSNTRYLGYVIFQNSGGVYVGRSTSTRYLYDSITEPEAELTPSTSQNYLGGRLGYNQDYIYPLKYLKIYSIDNGNIITFFTSDSITDLENNNIIYNTPINGNSFTTFIFQEINGNQYPVLGNFYSFYNEFYIEFTEGVKITNTNYMYYPSERYLYHASMGASNQTITSGIYSQMAAKMVVPEYDNEDNKIYIQKVDLELMFNETYEYSPTEGGIRVKPIRYISDELIAVYLHGGIGIQSGHIYNINNKNYIPCFPYVDPISKTEYVKTFTSYNENYNKKLLTIMMPVGSKGN